LPSGEFLVDRINEIVRPALFAGYFGVSITRMVTGIQYHLGGEIDTRELAELVGVTPEDLVLDVCSFLGGSAVQLAEAYNCKVTGLDKSKNCVAASNRIAELVNLDRLDFLVGDAASMPFEGACFTVVWSQASLDHDDRWLREFDRVLVPGGRLALTLAIRGTDPNEESPRWTLQDAVNRIKALHYQVDRVEDISERDIQIGWKALDEKLFQHHDMFAEALGEEWVRTAHRQFVEEIRKMREGRWGNGRIIAIKNHSNYSVGTGI
jgi:ubiquinone/menaquinone biosynthesis C-methylase UbiE